MTTVQKILVTLVAIILFNFLLVIVFGDKGLVELFRMKEDQAQVQKASEAIIHENLKTAKKIERLQKADPVLIEHHARRELGMVKPGEIVVKIHDPGPAGSGQMPEGEKSVKREE